MQQPAATRTTRQAIGVFLLLTFGLTAIFDLPLFGPEPLSIRGGPYLFAVMWSPGIAAVITLLLFRQSLASLGWRLGRPIYLLISLLLPIAYSLLAYGVVWASGLGGVDLSQLPNLPYVFSYGLFMNSLAVLGEEIGWRGFLVPRLAAITGFWTTCLLSGIIWAVWHYAAILIGGYNNGTSPLYSLVCFTIMIVGISFPLAWLQLRSGSLWTATLLHGMHNLFIQQVLDPVTTDTGNTPWIVSEFGAALAIMGVVVAAATWSVRHRLAAGDKGQIGALSLNAEQV